ncbi:MAG: hypothetical protein ABIR57_05920 [Aeromicrobium sp.]
MHETKDAAEGACSWSPQVGADKCVEDVVLRRVNEIVLDAAEAIHQIAEQHRDGHPQTSAHVQGLAETLAGSTIDWIRRWPS